MEPIEQEKEKGRKAQRLLIILMIVFIVAPLAVYYLIHPSH